jgi:cell shape-determining protein MreC
MNEPTLEYLPEKHTVQSGNKVYTSGKEGIFAPGIPIGEVRTRGEKIFVSLFSDISQITFVNINLGEKNN